MDFKSGSLARFLMAALWLVALPGNAGAAGNGELSVMGSYSKTDFGNNTYSTSKRYTASVGVNLTVVTEIQLSYMYSDTFFNYDPIQTISINEQTLALSVVQGLVPPSFLIQPYVKGGAAQYNRRQAGTSNGIPNAPTSTKSPSGVLGAGLRIYLLRNFSLKIEGVTYLPDMKLSQGRNNFAVQGGIGWNF